MPGGRVPWIWAEGYVSKVLKTFVVRGLVGGCYLYQLLLEALAAHHGRHLGCSS
jgi:hypothetical protein